MVGGALTAPQRVAICFQWIQGALIGTLMQSGLSTAASGALSEGEREGDWFEW
jgi:hypothetical protein